MSSRASSGDKQFLENPRAASEAECCGERRWGPDVGAGRGGHSVQPLTDLAWSEARNGQGPALPPAPAPHTSRLGGLWRKGQSTDPRLQVQGPTSEAQHCLGQRGRGAEGPAFPGSVLGRELGVQLSVVSYCLAGAEPPQTCGRGKCRSEREGDLPEVTQP